MKAQILALAVTIGLSVFGMMAIAWWNALTSPNSGRPSLRIFWKENKEPFLISIITIAFFVPLFVLVPGASDWLRTVTGITVTVPISNGSGLLIGAFFYEIVRKKFKGKKNVSPEPEA